MLYFIIFLVSIILHELGHFITGICCGVRIRKFCIFFDPGFKLLNTGKRFSTQFCLGWIPAGGYVLFDIPKEGEQETNKYIQTCRKRKKLMIYSSGLLVNLAIAYFSLFMFAGLCLKDMKKDYIHNRIKYTNNIIVKMSKWYYADIFSLNKKEPEKSEQKAEQTPYTYKTWYFDTHTKKPENKKSVLWKFYWVNMALFLFNILPFPPLDGGNIVFELLKSKKRKKVIERIQIACACIIGLIMIVSTLYYSILDFIHYVYEITTRA